MIIMRCFKYFTDRIRESLKSNRKLKKKLKKSVNILFAQKTQQFDHVIAAVRLCIQRQGRTSCNRDQDLTSLPDQ